MNEEEKPDKLTLLRTEITRMREAIVHYKERLKQLTQQEAALKKQVTDLEEENKKLQLQLQQEAENTPIPPKLPEKENDTLQLLDMEQCERWWLHLSHRIEELYVRLDRQNEKINRLAGRNKPRVERERQRPRKSTDNQPLPKTLQPTEPAEQEKRPTIKLTPAAIELTEWQKKNIEMSIQEHTRKREQGKEQKKEQKKEQGKKKENLIVRQETPPTEKVIEELDLPVYTPYARDKNTFYKWFTSRFGD